MYYYRKNLQGDITHIHDAAGALKAMYVYDAWGNHNIVVGSAGIGAVNPFRYRGYYFDTETGLYYLQSRYYDPETGRFINADDISYIDPESINGMNLYSYCANNPIMHSDPSGHAVLSILLGILVTVLISGAVAGTTSAIVAASTGQNIQAAFVGGFVNGAIGGLGIGLGVVTGGLGGLAIAGIAGFFGGLTGSVLEQGIASYAATGIFKVDDWESAIWNGVLSSILNMMSFGVNVAYMKEFVDLAGNFSARFAQAFALNSGEAFIDIIATSVAVGGLFALSETIGRIITFYSIGGRYGQPQVQ